MNRYEATLRAIDAANAGDPDTLRFEGVEHPRAGIEGERAHHWVEQLRPDASEVLRLATRAHHLRRWEVPRDSYPRTRAGYHAWRSGLYDFHAGALGDLMREAGYPADEIAAVAPIMGKGNIKTDRDAQSYEDALSLAFLELRLADFAPSVTDDQLMRALRRTWRKMSDAGHAVALQLDLSEEAAAIVGRALAD